MTNDKLDRRVLRTRQLLQDALVSLILEQGYDKVTVQDIIDRANVGRSTFYAHYQDKEDLLLRGVAEIAYGEELEEAVAEDVERLAQIGAGGTLSIFGMFAHIQQNERVHKAMFQKNNDNVILEKGAIFLYANLKAQLRRLYQDDQPPKVPISILTQYLTGGLMSLAQWWLDNDMPYTPQEMDELFQQMAMPGIRAVLEMEE